MTSRILSGSLAKLSVSKVSLDEAKISCAFVGKRCKNSCVIIEGSSCLSPSSCIRRRSWVGFRSPNCSAFCDWCSRCCSEADVRLTSFDFSRVYGFSAGGFIKRSRTSWETSG